MIQDKYGNEAQHRVVFKVKIADTLHPEYKAQLSFYNQNDEGYDSLREGDRISLVGVSMGKNRVNGSTLSISVKKGAMLKLI